MEHKHTLVQIDLGYCGASLVVCSPVREFIVGTEGFSVVASPNSAGDVILLCHDVVPDGINSIHVILLSCQGCNISHTCIHIACTHCVTPGFPLIHYGQVALAVLVLDFCLSAVVKEILGLVEILLLPCQQIKAGKGHLGNLVAGHHGLLSFTGTDLADYAVGILLRYVEKLGAAGGLVMSAGRIYHMAEVVEFVAAILDCLPAFASRPGMRVLRIHRAGGVKISVRLLGRGHNVQHAVDITLEFLVRIGLQDVAGTLDGLVDVGVVEWKCGGTILR